MLYPIATDSRIVMDLSGVWKFLIDKEEGPIEVSQPLPTNEVMAILAPFNDQTAKKRPVSTMVIFGMKENFLFLSHREMKESYYVLVLLHMKHGCT